MKKNPLSKIPMIHFTKPKHLRGGMPIPPKGKWIVVDGPPMKCEWGFHACQRFTDALQLAPGIRMHIVKLGGKFAYSSMCSDKQCATRRKILHSFTVDQSKDIIRECFLAAALELVDKLKPSKSTDLFIRWLKRGMPAYKTLAQLDRVTGRVHQNYWPMAQLIRSISNMYRINEIPTAGRLAEISYCMENRPSYSDWNGWSLRCKDLVNQKFWHIIKRRTGIDISSSQQ